MKEKVTRYCRCGAAMQADLRGPDADRKLAELERLWKSGHSGEGHAECDAATAARARRKQEKEER